jgi:NADH:ubiquinone oxidoreductase subunit F (NADH-binding)
VITSGTGVQSHDTTGNDRSGCSALLLERVRVARAGPASRLDGLDGRSSESWAEHVSRVGPRPAGAPWLVEALEESALTGFGGGHFPVGRKWRSLLRASRVGTVVANGAESESLSAKDATLLRQRPHLVLDGLHCAIETVGAQRGVVWLHAADRYTREVVETAVRERVSAGVSEADIVVAGGPDTYLSGESSAIIRALSGGPVLPAFRGVRHRTSRGAGPATLVHNVETLARVALAARECAFSDSRPRLECFAPGPLTSLLTVLTAEDRHVIEVPCSMTLRAAVASTGWSEGAPPTAVLLGGYGGLFARWSEVADLEVNEPAMRRAGRTLGAGIVAPLPARVCGVAETARIASYLASSSARQCGPCMFGLASLADSLDILRAGSARRGELRRLAADLDAVRGRGACHHPDGVTRLVTSALETFEGDFADHAAGRPCCHGDSVVIPVPAVRRCP